MVRSLGRVYNILIINLGKGFDTFVVVLRVDIVQCLEEKRQDPSLQCPDDVTQIAFELLKPAVNKVCCLVGRRVRE